jgi:hypothetical protein
MTAPDGRDLYVNDFGGCQNFVRQPRTGTSAIGPVVADSYREYARINDDHVLPERDSLPC